MTDPRRGSASRARASPRPELGQPPPVAELVVAPNVVLPDERGPTVAELLADWRAARQRLRRARGERRRRERQVVDELRDRYRDAVVGGLRGLPGSRATVRVSATGRLTHPSSQLLSLLGLPGTAVHGASIGCLGRPGTGAAELGAFLEFVASGEPVEVVEQGIVLGDGREAVFRVTLVLDLERPDTYTCHFERLGVPMPATPRSTAEVLAEWRRVEGQLPTSDTPHRYGLQTRAATLKAEYQALVRGLLEGT